MKKKLVVVFLLYLLTGCTQFMAEITGMEFLHDRRTRESISKDLNIEQEAYQKISVLRQLKSKSRVKVNSYNSAVLLTGEVETAEIRDQIIANIRIIKNIRVIYNELAIMTLASQRIIHKDTLIKESVGDVLSGIVDYPDFDETRVRVVVSTGDVYLMGLLYKAEAEVVVTKIQQIEKIKSIINLFQYISLEKIQK
jgi:osmotically-inducible protein OsmY